jgi:hypothetical protein
MCPMSIGDAENEQFPDAALPSLAAKLPSDSSDAGLKSLDHCMLNLSVLPPPLVFRGQMLTIGEHR